MDHFSVVHTVLQGEAASICDTYDSDFRLSYIYFTVAFVAMEDFRPLCVSDLSVGWIAFSIFVLVRQH